MDKKVLNQQSQHWESSFSSKPEMFGLEPSYSAQKALEIFKSTPEAILTEKRFVGRKQLPSSVIGLYFHAAEHSQRHIGQMLVTISVLKKKF